ncbi:MAG: ABC transporter permease [Saccharofermentanales bacterium]
MFKFAVKKLYKNKWLFISLSLSIVLFITAVCLLPMFNNSLFNRMLLLNFKNATDKSGVYSNRCDYFMNMSEETNKAAQKDDEYSDLIENKLIRQLRQPVAYMNKMYTSKTISLTEITGHTDNALKVNNIRVFSLNNFNNNIKIISGRLPSDKLTAEKAYEVVISNDTAKHHGLVIDRSYIMNKETDNGDFKQMVKVVGIFEPIIGGTSMINNESVQVLNGVVCDYKVFKTLFIDKSAYLISVRWNYLLDYTSLGASDIPAITEAAQEQALQLGKLAGSSMEKPFAYYGMDIFDIYKTGSKSLSTFILVFTLPMYLLLIFCIFFISKLIVEMDQNEISVLQSRGASIKKIGGMYFMQSAMLLVVPFLISPFLAVAVCKILGRTIGFFEFGNNVSLATSISIWVVLFDLFACLVVIMTILIPSIYSARTNIVERKQKTSGKPHVPFWKKFYLDFIFLGLSAYGYYNFMNRQKTITSREMFGNQLPIEPLTFLIMVLFLVSAGMIFMRLYPFIMAGISRLGARLWSASMYSSLRRVTVLRDKEQFIMMFLVLTLSLGIFSANSARTINQNIDDYIMYNGGADIVLNAVPSNKQEPEKLEVKTPASYFKGLAGVEDLTIISTAVDVEVYNKTQKNENPVKILGIDTVSFSKVAWSRPDMMDMHLNGYLNLLSKDPYNCFISRSLADEMGYIKGDEIIVNPSARGQGFGSKGLKLKLAAIIDTWPSYNYAADEEGNLALGDIIIANSSVMEQEYLDLTYNIMLKTDGIETESSVIANLKSQFLGVEKIHDYYQDVAYSKNSAERQSLNTLLTFSFIIIFMVCFIGFLIYWIISIRSRVFQFGILRAMGLSARSIYAMIVYEQAFITLVTSVFAVFVGGLASRVFFNILKLAFGADAQLLPFKFFTTQVDFVKIYLFFGSMILVTFVIITVLVKRIKIAQTIKLGED